MTVLSKILGMSIPQKCDEVLHTWQPDCNNAALLLGSSFFRESLKMYTSFYLITLLIRGKLSFKTCMNTLTNILRSSTFLGIHGFGVIFFSCILRKLLGRYYFLTYCYISTFISCILGLLIEKKSRRLPLAIYVANVATETILRMAAARGIVKPVPNSEVYLFSTLMAIQLFIAKKYGYSEDVVSSIFKFILGDNETVRYEKSDQKKTLPISGTDPVLERAVLCGGRLEGKVETSFLQKMWSSIKHSSCPHDYSCFLYCLQGFIRPFLIGLALSTKRLFSFRKKIMSNPYILFPLLFEKKFLSLGLFLGGFGATFRIINCLLRWCFDKDHASYAVPAALLGGLFMKLYPSPSISLYLMWKTLEKGYLMGMEKGGLPHVKLFTLLLYSASSALLCHVGIFEPQNLKPTYLKFLSTLSHNRLNLCSHDVLDAYRTKTSLSE